MHGQERPCSERRRTARSCPRTAREDAGGRPRGLYLAKEKKSALGNDRIASSESRKKKKKKHTGSKDDDLRGTTVQRLGGFVGTFLQLAVMRRLLDEIENGLRESLVGDGPGWKHHSVSHGVTTLKMNEMETYRRWFDQT